jgi:hypothetical protein
MKHSTLPRHPRTGAVLFPRRTPVPIIECDVCSTETLVSAVHPTTRTIKAVAMTASSHVLKPYEYTVAQNLCAACFTTNNTQEN